MVPGSFTLSARHSAPPIASANDESGLYDRGKDNHASALSSKPCGMLSGHRESPQDRPTILQPFVIFGLVRGVRHLSKKRCKSKPEAAQQAHKFRM